MGGWGRGRRGERSKKWPVNCGDRKKGGEGDITPERRTHTTEYNSTVHPISLFFVGFVLNFSPSLVMRENLLRSPFHIFGGSPLILAGIPARISPLILIQFPKYCPLEGKELLVKNMSIFSSLVFSQANEKYNHLPSLLPALPSCEGYAGDFFPEISQEVSTGKKLSRPPPSPFSLPPPTNRDVSGQFLNIIALIIKITPAHREGGWIEGSEQLLQVQVEKRKTNLFSPSPPQWFMSDASIYFTLSGGRGAGG